MSFSSSAFITELRIFTSNDKTDAQRFNAFYRRKQRPCSTSIETWISRTRHENDRSQPFGYRFVRLTRRFLVVYYALEIGRVPGHYLVTIDARTIRNTIDTQERRLNRVTRSLWPMNKRSIWRRWRSLRIHKVTITRRPIIINLRSSA